MPKIVSEDERGLVREAIYQAAIALIRDKGLKHTTVDDIAKAVAISKGAFYAYYPSKEVCLYETLKRSERELFSRLEGILAQDPKGQAAIAQGLREIFLSPGSVILYASPAELEALIRKLPPEYRQRENKKSEDYFQRSMKLLRVGKGKMEVVAMLTDCLGIVASNDKFSEKGKQKALDILVDAMSAYLSQED